MAKIKPFSAVTYNTDVVKDYSRVACPPYDVISSEDQEKYYKASPYNFIRLELGKDTPEEDRYKSAHRILKEWIKEDVLTRAAEPAIYFYNQIFTIKGEKKSRLGFIALLRLEEDKHVVFPHESTRSEAKDDRTKLISSVKANLSPIFVVFSDTGRVIQRVAEKNLSEHKPFIDITDKDGVRHQLWRVSDKEAVDKIVSQMHDKHLFIADGHHRYEVALRYSQKMRESGHADPEADCNYLMAYFTNTESRGLSILPIHRVVHVPAHFDFEAFRKQLKEYFDIEDYKDRNKFFFLMHKAGERQNALGMYKDETFYLLRLKSPKLLEGLADPTKPKEYRGLDIAVLNYVILQKILGLDIEDKVKIHYSHDEDELVKTADEHKNTVVFLLNPVKIEQLIAIAKLRERMPSKSTFFYPKVLSGLVVNKFKE